MCRLFGFRSVLQSQVHRSLIHAENALALQSERHPDGWGVAYYMADSPHIIRSVSTAINDSLFKKVSGIVSSKTVLAHLRKSTIGSVNILNTHPFQYGRWIFAHNGTLNGFLRDPGKVHEKIGPELKRFILGETDSELLFYLLLSRLQRRRSLDQPIFEMTEVFEAIQETMQIVTEICTDYEALDLTPDKKESSCSFLLTNGSLIVGHCGGQELHYSTFKDVCSERDTCPHFAQSCEAKTESGTVNHLIFSSEPLVGENIWAQLQPNQMIGVDWQMKLYEANSLP